MTPLQLQLYLDLLAKDWDRVHAMGALQPPPPHANMLRTACGARPRTVAEAGSTPSDW